MPAYLVLDSEAVNALARADERSVAARRAQAVLTEAARRNTLVRIPAGVLVEVYRGTARDSGIDHVVGRGNRVVVLDHRCARVAGGLLGRDRLDSSHAVDASVVATAIGLGGAVIATGDPGDIKSLARDHRNIAVFPLA